MPSPIARRPSGLLDLLLTQQQGKNPSLLGESLSPVLDLGKFYESDRLTTATLAITVTATGVSSTTQVPSGEVWKLLGFGARGTFATVNQRLSLSFRLSTLPGGGIVDMAALTFAPTGAVDKFGDGFMMPEPMILPPGSSITAVATNLNLDGQANIGVSGGLLFVRMDV